MLGTVLGAGVRTAGSPVSTIAVAALGRVSGSGLIGTLRRTFRSVCRAIDISRPRALSTASAAGGPIAAIAASRSGKRAAGSFASMRAMASDTPDGRSGRSCLMFGGSLNRCCVMISAMLLPSNGFFPVSISYATTPSEYWSDAGVAGLSWNCSGLM